MSVAPRSTSGPRARQPVALPPPARPSSTTSVLRLYESVRSTHLADIRTMVPGRLLYRERMYDFEPELADGMSVQQAGRFATAWQILRGSETVVELNEPLMVRAWPSLIAYTTAIRFARRFLRRKIVVSSYAIENHSPVDAAVDFVPLPRVVVGKSVRVVCRYILRPIDRIGFGTDDAYQNYVGLVGQALEGKAVRLTLELPTPCQCGPPNKNGSLLFVGEFSDRKGVRQLMKLWDRIGDDAKLSLTIIGKGPLIDIVTMWARDHPSVTLVIDPSRSEIHTYLRGASVVVLLSQTVPRWKEQIGLPIMEGLAHGCEIISTDQTGYARWLLAHQHVVVQQDPNYKNLALLTQERMRNARHPSEILGSLPSTSVRHEFDTWLNQLDAVVV